MPASTVPAAKAALLALMRAWPWPTSTPDIRWGGPTENEDLPAGGEIIYFGAVEIDDEPATLGGGRNDETYTLQIVIDVVQYGDDEQATENRAWELYASLGDLLHSDQTLTGAINRMDGRTVRQTNLPTPNQWVCRIVVDQECVGLVFNT